MNGTKIACVLLMMLLAGIAYGTQIMHQRAKSAYDEAETAASDAQTAQTNATVAETALLKVKFDTQDLRQFLDEWTPHVKRIQSVQDAEQAMQSVVRNSGILTVSQKFEVRELRDNKMIPKVLQGTIVVADEFSKTMNWLGELERRVPLARITSTRLKQGETGRQVNLEVRLEIPLVDMNASQEAPPAH